MRFVDETISYLRDMLWYPRGSPAIPKPCWRLLGLAALCDAVALILLASVKSPAMKDLLFEILIVLGCAAVVLAASASVIEFVRSARRAHPDRAPFRLRIDFHTLAMLTAVFGSPFAASCFDLVT